MFPRTFSTFHLSDFILNGGLQNVDDSAGSSGLDDSTNHPELGQVLIPSHLWCSCVHEKRERPQRTIPHRHSTNSIQRPHPHSPHHQFLTIAFNVTPLHSVPPLPTHPHGFPPRRSVALCSVPPHPPPPPTAPHPTEKPENTDTEARLSQRNERNDNNGGGGGQTGERNDGETGERNDGEKGERILYRSKLKRNSLTNTKEKSRNGFFCPVSFRASR